MSRLRHDLVTSASQSFSSNNNNNNNKGTFSSGLLTRSIGPILVSEFLQITA